MIISKLLQQARLKKSLLKINFLVPVMLSTIIVLTTSPTINYKIGNLFFGDVSTLYNVNLAQIFFIQASYPVLGKPTRYAHYQLSRTYFIKGDLKEALAEVNKELEHYPDTIKGHYVKGLTLGYMNHEVEAIKSFSTYLEKDPTSWPGRNDKAWLQFRTGDIDGAHQTILPVTKEGSSGFYSPWVQNTYGTILLNQKRYKEAREAFLRADKVANMMTAESWGRAYPGNDPRIYNVGLSAMKQSIKNNLLLVSKKISEERKSLK